jgi:prepilin-type N-terminal cleavage/methylation domain-containing protein
MSKITRHFVHKRNISADGFTLIELLVVFALIAMLTAFGIASYSAYNSSQIVQSSASTVATLLNTARSRAISQVIPSSCGTNFVTGYQVDITVTGQQYTLSAMCGSKQVVSTNNLPSQVTFATGSTATIVYAISSGTVATPATILITGYGKTKTITVNGTGNVAIQ